MAPASNPSPERRRRRGRTLVVGGVVVALAIAAVPITGMLSGADAAEGSTTTTTEVAASTAAITRGDISTDFEFNGEVEYGDSWGIPLAVDGVVTSSSESGTIVDFGEVIIAIDQQPLILAEGDVPMYRELSRTSPRMSGADVEQLQRFLIDQGFDDDGGLEVDGEFGYATERAVEDWQEALGLEETGRVDQTMIVFSPVPLRLAGDSRVGAAFAGLEVSEAVPLVIVDTGSLDRSGLPVGAAVSVELADGESLPGTIADQARVILEDGSAVWRTTIDLEDLPPSDTSLVIVHSTVIAANDVLQVPVAALLALAEGGFAVEKVTQGGTELVAVEVGEVVAGVAEITGDIEEGDEVVVPE